MKNKGISLIVLIITIVVIIILATAIIVNLAQTNMIENAKEATVKQDFKTLQDELNLYIADKYADTLGKFKAEDLDVTDKAEIAEIIPSIKGTKYEDYVVIEDGKIAVSEEIPEKERTWALEVLGEIKVTTNRPVEPDEVLDATAPSVPVTLEFVITDTTITAVASGSIDETDAEVEYEYSIDNKNWQESGVFENLEALTTYTIYARAIDDAGNVSEVKQSTATTKYALITDSNKTLNGATATYSNPIIPVGFRALETADATWSDTDNDGNPDGWNNGLVIEDEKGNEFVWVPVDGTNVTYTKKFDEYPNNYQLTGVIDDLEAIPVENETTQITKHGGFYVGRYECGVPANQTVINSTSNKSNTTGTPVIQKGIRLWSWIAYDNANKNSLNFNNSTYVKSGLVTGTAWDTLCTWIDSEKDENGNSIHNVMDSSSWGNHAIQSGEYTTGVGFEATGYNEKWKAKNIYDMAGNAYEWTAEKSSTQDTYRIARGGSSYSSLGSKTPVSYRYPYSGYLYYISFRIMLYVI